MSDQSSTESQPETIDAETVPQPETTEATDNKPVKPKRKSTKTKKIKPVKGAEVAVVESGPLSIPKKGMSLLDLGVNPTEVIDIGVEIANALKKIVERPANPLYAMVKGRKHVMVEGWTTMGAMLGVFPREVESKEIKDGCWETTVELQKITDGTIVGRASHICSRKERTWKSRDEYAIKSMSATRAVGKAYRLGFSWIMVLAGYSPTPEEEMRFNEEAEEKPPFNDEPALPVADKPEKPKPVEKPNPTDVYTASDQQKIQLAQLFKDASLFDVPSLRLISQWMKNEEMMFKHAGDLIYLLKRYQVSKSELPIVANSLQELGVPQVEEYLINFRMGENDSAEPQ